MIAKLILTHGPIARELLEAARTITSREPEGFRAVCLDWEDSLEEARAKTERALSEMDCRAGVLILTDMFGGTPYNVALGLREAGRVEVLTGVNVPMVLRLACGNGGPETVGELAELLVAKGRGSICRASPETETASCACGTS